MFLFVTVKTKIGRNLLFQKSKGAQRNRFYLNAWDLMCILSLGCVIQGSGMQWRKARAAPPTRARYMVRLPRFYKQHWLISAPTGSESNVFWAQSHGDKAESSMQARVMKILLWCYGWFRARRRRRGDSLAEAVYFTSTIPRPNRTHSNCPRSYSTCYGLGFCAFWAQTIVAMLVKWPCV